MSLFKWLGSLGHTPQPRIKIVKGRFDSAQTTGDNARHWSAAEALSADGEASASVRQVLRTRARYEVANNAYARGIVLTLANDSVGIGPRLQMLLDNDALNRQIEQDFIQWSKAVRLPEKLRAARMARCQDGEAFLFLAQNPNLAKSEVKLDIQLIEADRVTDDSFSTDTGKVEGIEFDAFGNPTFYNVLRHHPSDLGGSSNDAIKISAANMVHVFRSDRPGQHRGIPEITASLPLFAQLRRFTLAVLSAAEAAADFAGILYTDAPASGEAADIDPMDNIQLERNMLLTMPGGWKMAQLDPKQPATTYAEFKHEILNEIARTLNMPYNIAAGNSSGYNYASGRLDHQTYYKAIRVDQSFTENVVLDPILDMWLREWSLLHKKLIEQPIHSWFWDGLEHVDPAKEANAQEKRLLNCTTSLAAEYAKQGKDWEAEVYQIAKERETLKKLGIPFNEAVDPQEPEEPEDDEN